MLLAWLAAHFLPLDSTSGWGEPEAKMARPCARGQWAAQTGAEGAAVAPLVAWRRQGGGRHRAGTKRVPPRWAADHSVPPPCWSANLASPTPCQVAKSRAQHAAGRPSRLTPSPMPN